MNILWYHLASSYSIYAIVYLQLRPIKCYWSSCLVIFAKCKINCLLSFFHQVVVKSKHWICVCTRLLLANMRWSMQMYYLNCCYVLPCIMITCLYGDHDNRPDINNLCFWWSKAVYCGDGNNIDKIFLRYNVLL